MNAATRNQSELLSSFVTTALPDLGTRDELAAVLKIHVRTIDVALASGELECVRIGRAVRIPRAAVIDWLTRKGGR